MSLESKIEFFGEKAEGIRRNEIMAVLAVAAGDPTTENLKKRSPAMNKGRGTCRGHFGKYPIVLRVICRGKSIGTYGIKLLLESF